MIWCLAGVAVISLAALVIIFTMVFGSEDAPNWVEMDEYYRSRWYK